MSFQKQISKLAEKTALFRKEEKLSKSSNKNLNILQISINLEFQQISFRAPPPSGSSCYGVDLNRLFWGITASCICNDSWTQITDNFIFYCSYWSSICSLSLIFKLIASLKSIDLISYFIAQGTGIPLGLVLEQRQQTHAG